MNQVDYGERVYDPRVGRFLSVDPLARNFAWNSPYSYAENSPIKYIDLDGLEKYDPASKPTGVTHVQLATVPIAPTDANLDYSIKAGKYQLHPVSDPSGKRNAYWLARYSYTEGPYAGMHRDDWIVGTDGVGDFVKNADKYYNKAGWLEHLGGADQQFNLKSVLNGWKDVNSNPINWVIGASIYASAFRSVMTPYGAAYQEVTAGTNAAMEAVESGATLYRIGTKGLSKEGAEAQFWSLENPLSMGAEEYAKKYGIKLSRIQNANFVETATLKKGAKFITRKAPVEQGAPAGAGGGIEAVVETGGTTGNVIIPIKR